MHETPGGPESTPDDEPLGVPLMVSGQQTSLSPGFVGTHPAATAAFVASPESQSSFRGLPACSAQSDSVSESAFCLHGTLVPPLELDELDGNGLPHEPPSHFALPVHGVVLRDG